MNGEKLMLKQQVWKDMLKMDIENFVKQDLLGVSKAMKKVKK